MNSSRVSVFLRALITKQLNLSVFPAHCSRKQLTRFSPKSSSTWRFWQRYWFSLSLPQKRIFQNVITFCLTVDGQSFPVVFQLLPVIKCAPWIKIVIQKKSCYVNIVTYSFQKAKERAVTPLYRVQSVHSLVEPMMNEYLSLTLHPAAQHANCTQIVPPGLKSFLFIWDV